jgi:hypothetical protein
MTCNSRSNFRDGEIIFPAHLGSETGDRFELREGPRHGYVCTIREHGNRFGNTITVRRRDLRKLG